MADFNLGANEQAVLAAASRIFSGLATTAKMSNENHAKAFKYSLDTAHRMAKAINKSTKVQNLVEGGEVPFPW